MRVLLIRIPSFPLFRVLTIVIGRLTIFFKNVNINAIPLAVCLAQLDIMRYTRV